MTSPAESSQQPLLPIDVYLEILKFLPASKDDSTSIKTLASCLQANSSVRAAALSPLAWEHHYRIYYTHCVQANEAERKERTACDWRLMFAERRRLDRRALKLADEIRLHPPAERHEKAREIAKMSYDVWDVLRMEENLRDPLYFKSAGDSDAEEHCQDEIVDVLPRKFWAKAILGIIARRESIPIWRRIFDPPPDARPVSFVETLSTLSSGFDVSIAEINMELEAVYRKWLQFQRVLNQFPHAVLQIPEYRQTIPMSLVFLFVAMAQRMGIDASPVNWPGVVKAHVTSPDPLEPDFIVDVTADSESRICTPIEVLLQGGAGPENVSPASSRAMLTRVFANVTAFSRFVHMLSTGYGRAYEVLEATYYVIELCNALRLEHGAAVPSPPDFKPLDLVVVLADGIGPMLFPTRRESLAEYVDNTLRENQRVIRREDGVDVTGFVGMVFKHKRYGYTGCIYSWDPTCMAGDTWMEEMGVDELPSGRNQPFYQVLATDGRTFYASQDNIDPIFATQEIVRSLFDSRTSFGRYFTGVDVDSQRYRVRLTVSQELKWKYPDDEDYGRIWVHGQ
ncbi:hypothetical protein BXZ70DRAFT_1009164 [Cristinia sonorae]|uniref:Hemimethylated DNA-binding domain-containing protein n=1 Tax=Cristinia sonorae TaxID=1940300 RepID=A0A8K0UL63_9AGAR|nr:hypothetical protein BXZ70DRAFT_1009164 [Cristinia sonorae]